MKFGFVYSVKSQVGEGLWGDPCPQIGSPQKNSVENKYFQELEEDKGILLSEKATNLRDKKEIFLKANNEERLLTLTLFKN